MLAASLNKSSQASFEHANLTNRSLSSRLVSYLVIESVRRTSFLRAPRRKGYEELAVMPYMRNEAAFYATVTVLEQIRGEATSYRASS